MADLSPASPPTPAGPPALDEPPRYADAATAARVREALLGAGYREATLVERLGVADLGSLRLSGRAVLRQRVAGDTTLEVLTRLFALGLTVPAALAEAALPLPLAQWRAAGLLATTADGVRATVHLVPWQQHGREVLIASDRQRYADLPPAHVMGLAASTRKLAALTVRRPGGRVLDLGTGCGAQALLAALHAQGVVATDLNPRAVALCAGNAVLNGLDNLDSRLGDLFQPVAGERFDLIVSHPPFVVSPRTAGPRLLFQDGGLAGDALCRQIVAQVPAHLNEGGLCQLLVHWEVPAGGDAQEAIAGWFAGSPCDAWVLCGRVTPVAEYAAAWIAQTERDDLDLREALHRAWLSDFASRGVAAVGYGLVTLRRRGGGTPWLRYEDAPPERGPCGEALWRGFLLRDYLDARDDRALLDARLRLPAALRLERTLAPTPMGFVPESDQVYLAQGLGYRAEVSRPVHLLLGSCRGQRRLREVLEDMAGTLRQPWEALVGPCLPIVRDMISQGLLLPEEIGE